LAAHIATLKASGHKAEAAELEARLAASERLAADNLPMQWQASFDTGVAAFQASRLEEAEKAFKSAIDLAEKLQPHDDRLTRSLQQLGAVYVRQQRFAEADTYKHRALIVAEQIHGAGSAETFYPLMSIGISLEQQQQAIQAETYYLRALQVGEKYFGPQNFNVSGVLGRLGAMYYNQRWFDKAEPVYRRQLEMEEARLGAENFLIVSTVERMGNLYAAWGKYDKAEPYYRRMLALQEKQFGAKSAALVSTLANLKRNMGAAEEARQLDRRRETLETSVATRK
jgi:tetratricopeptide (TPR) repeat protein